MKVLLLKSIPKYSTVMTGSIFPTATLARVQQTAFSFAGVAPVSVQLRVVSFVRTVQENDRRWR